MPKLPKMKKNSIPQNYLLYIPSKSKKIGYSADQNGIVTIEKENTGFVNKLAQKVFKKPKISYIHLDEFGSFVWLQINGETDIETIGKSVHEHFGDKAEPLYPRLAKYFQILESYGFVNMKKP